MNIKPLLSVCMITYNHESFITQAIEGVLMQKTDFPVEIIIGDDYSTDNTRRICLEYQAKFPQIINVLHRDKNIGVSANFIDALKNCQGKYIALCEGDDFWTDSGKLQKQVDFLESHSDFAVSHHRMKIVYEDQPEKSTLTPDCLAETTFENLAMRQHISTASCVFRNNVSELPKMFSNVYGMDYTLNLFNATFGKIKYFSEVMGVYRVHNQGEWSGKNTIQKSEKAIQTVRMCKDHFSPRASKEFEFHISKMICLLDFEKGLFKNYRSGYIKFFRKFFLVANFRDWIVLSTRLVLSLSNKLSSFYRITIPKLKNKFNFE